MTPPDRDDRKARAPDKDLAWPTQLKVPGGREDGLTPVQLLKDKCKRSAEMSNRT